MCTCRLARPTMGSCVWWCRGNSLLRVFVLLSSVVIEGNLAGALNGAHHSMYRLVPPELYVVFGGDLEVLFHMPGNVSLPNAFVQLQGQRPRDKAWIEVTTMGLPLTRKTGTLTVACGIVEFAGRYSLTMVMQVDGPVLTHVTFTCVWPSLTLRLPDTHAALTSSVTMEIESRATCSSRLQREFLTLELYFQRFQDSGSSFVNFSNEERVTAANFTSIDKLRFKWNYACEMFDQEGYYQAGVRSSTGTSLTVSNMMTSTFSASYHLSSERSSVFPCRTNSSVSIRYTHPPCAGRGVDRFRVYKLVRRVSESSEARLVERAYVGEFEVHPSGTRVEVGCEVVEMGQEVVGYCWVYVTVARSGAVVEQRELCLPAWPGGVLPQDGGWSSWTVWTTCSVTCGQGKRSRFRICNNPPPENGGRECAGHPKQWSYCVQNCPDLLPRSPLSSPQFDPSCLCGCTRTTESGEIIASGRCPGLTTWIIKTLPQQRVVLTFRYFSISFEKQWVKVRDGGTESDELLFYSRHQLQPPGDVTSSSNVMRVDLMTETGMTSPVGGRVFPRNATMPIHVQGFIAAYYVKVPGSSPLPPPIYRHEDASVMDSDVTIVGLAVVGLVVVAVAVFAVAQRKIWRKKKKARHSADKTVEEGPGTLGQAEYGVPVHGDFPLAGDPGSGRKSSSDPRLASRTSSFTSTGSHPGKARAHVTGSTAHAQGKTRAHSPDSTSNVPGKARAPSPVTPGDRKRPAMPAVHPHPRKGASARPRRHSASLEESLRDDLKTTPAYAVVHQFAPTPEHRLGELKPSSRYPSASTPPRYPSPIKPEPTERKHRKRKGVSTRYSAEGRGGDREVMSLSRVSSSSNPTGEAPSGHQTTTTAEINILHPESMSGCVRSPEDPSVSNPGRSVRSRTDHQHRRVRRDKNRRRSDGDKHVPREHVSLVRCGEEPHLLQSHANVRPSSVHRETSLALPTTQVKRPVSVKENFVSLKPASVETTFSVESPVDTEPKRNRSRTKPPLAEQETLLPRPLTHMSKPTEAETTPQKGRNSGCSNPSKSSSVVAKREGYKALSPSRAAEVELEYDDFALDDPQCYFQYEDLSPHQWGTRLKEHST